MRSRKAKRRGREKEEKVGCFSGKKEEEGEKIKAAIF